MGTNRFNVWNSKKQETHFNAKRPFFLEGEIWWAQLGQNISTEVLGKGQDFLRPIYVLKRVYGNACIALPLTSKIRKGSYYFQFIDKKKNMQCALLAQCRYIDGKRLKYQLSKLNLSTQKQIEKAFVDFIKK